MIEIISLDWHKFNMPYEFFELRKAPNVSLSIPLPEPLISKLDAYAAALAKSRSSVVREPVSAYLLHRAATVWLPELA